MVCKYYLKVDSFHITALFWDIPEGQWWREILQLGRTSISAPNYLLCLEGEVVRCCEYIAARGLWPTVCLDGGWLEKNTIGILVTRSFGGKVCGYTSLSGKNCRYLCPMWMLTNRWPQQRRILIIEWIAWLSLWIPVSLFLQLPLSLSNGLNNKVYMMAGSGR